MAEPFGEKGLKVDEAREFAALMRSTPVGSAVGVVVAGPMDKALPKSSDVLLKVIEEFPETVMFPILWAWDFEGVTKTIRSRCLDRWSPLEGIPPVDEELDQVVYTLMDSVRSGQLWRVPPLVSSMKDRLPALLDGLSEALVPWMGDLEMRGLWEGVRKAALWPNPTLTEVVVSLLRGVPRG
jgi:hypothetical protein